MVFPATIILVLMAASAAMPATSAATPAATDLNPANDPRIDHWHGSIELPGLTLEFAVRFIADPSAAGGWAAELDIPQQGVVKAAMSNVAYTDTELAFTFAGPGAVFRGAIDADGRTALGTLEQGGQTFQVAFTRLTEDQALAKRPQRPQTPQPPFPYQERHVTYRNDIDGVTIAGTLTIPRGDGPFPAVVMITGTGAQDRDLTIMGHQPFRVLADHLGRHGIAVLRSDDRGVGGTGGSVRNSTSENFALDALAGLAFLESVDRIDPARRGLIGHSEGGLAAVLAAAQSDDVAFIVKLAGPALPGDEILRMQTRLLLAAAGAHTTEQIDEIVARHRALTESVMNDEPDDAQLARMKDLMRAQGVTSGEEDLTAAAHRHLSGVRTPRFRFFMAHDPRTALRRVRCPVLALYGSLDLQVPARENIEAAGRTLAEGGNPDATVMELDGLNHLFQTATTGSPAEYAVIEETLAPAALELITAWIRERF